MNHIIRVMMINQISNSMHLLITISRLTPLPPTPGCERFVYTVARVDLAAARVHAFARDHIPVPAYTRTQNMREDLDTYDVQR